MCPSRSEPKLCPFPFLQEDLYTAKQPGGEVEHSCYKTAQGNRNVGRFAPGIRNEWGRERERERERGRGKRDAFSINTPFPAFSSRTLLPCYPYLLSLSPFPLPPRRQVFLRHRFWLLIRRSFAGLFIVDGYYEVYVWEGWMPEDDDDVRTGSGRQRWDRDRKLAMETALSYAKGVRFVFVPLSLQVIFLSLGVSLCFSSLLVAKLISSHNEIRDINFSIYH